DRHENRLVAPGIRDRSDTRDAIDRVQLEAAAVLVVQPKLTESKLLPAIVLIDEVSGLALFDEAGDDPGIVLRAALFPAPCILEFRVLVERLLLRVVLCGRLLLCDRLALLCELGLPRLVRG